MFGKNHTCVKFTTQQDVLKAVEKKTHMCGKSQCQFVFLRSCKNQACVAFIKYLQKTKVCGKRHTCLKKQTCVSFSNQVVLLFVFARVFEFLIYHIIHFIYISHFKGAHAISDVQNTFKTVFKRQPTWENPHTQKKKHQNK